MLSNFKSLNDLQYSQTREIVSQSAVIQYALLLSISHLSKDEIGVDSCTMPETDMIYTFSKKE